MNIEVYERPSESPVAKFPDTDIRIYYNGHWVDFRRGQIVITKDESAKEQGVQAGPDGQWRCVTCGALNYGRDSC